MAVASLIDVQGLLNAQVEARSKSRTGARDTRKFVVSDAGTCLRKRYLARLGVPSTTEIPVATLRKMAAGDAGHEAIASLLRSSKALIAAEGEFETAHLLGHFDGLLRVRSASQATADGYTHQKAMLEVKTVEKWGMSHIKGGCSCSDKKTPGHTGPKREHILQLLTYWALGRRDYIGLDQAVLFYVMREDFSGVQFTYTWAPWINQAVLKEWLSLIGYWQRQELPPCSCKKDYGGAGVNYCKYQDGHGGCCNINEKGEPLEESS